MMMMMIIMNYELWKWRWGCGCKKEITRTQNRRKSYQKVYVKYKLTSKVNLASVRPTTLFSTHSDQIIFLKRLFVARFSEKMTYQYIFSHIVQRHIDSKHVPSIRILCLSSPSPCARTANTMQVQCKSQCMSLERSWVGIESTIAQQPPDQNGFDGVDNIDDTTVCKEVAIVMLETFEKLFVLLTWRRIHCGSWMWSMSTVASKVFVTWLSKEFKPLETTFYAPWIPSSFYKQHKLRKECRQDLPDEFASTLFYLIRMFLKFFQKMSSWTFWTQSRVSKYKRTISSNSEIWNGGTGGAMLQADCP